MHFRYNSIKKIFLILSFFLALLTGLSAQDSQSKDIYPFKITKPDSILLIDLPELTFQKDHLKTSLPSQLDNSVLPYFMPIFEQESLECGQQAGISYVFGYEWNYAHGTSALNPENQFPTHYTFNFNNGGYGWTGVSYIHSFEIARTNGHPTVVDYGGINEGGVSRWLSGYDHYFNGMSHKIDSVFQIKVGTIEGLLVLKNWLYNHLIEGEEGGIACFYSANPWNPVELPAGTPEGGKHVITEFIPNAGHANTIVGYNDSIRYDYNQDGQYTNHLDINNDGMVDMKDWEIGGLLFTESYNGGVNWADSGFCYMMYKTLAEKDGEGGIWNHSVHVLKVKENYEPQLTAKVKIKHSSRNKIKVSVKVSSPSFGNKTLSFPIFNYQGGGQYMQGGNNPDALELEMGFDITSLLGFVKNAEPTLFSLIINNNDPMGWGSGSITNFSIIDYTNGFSETVCSEQNVPIVNNDQTILNLLKTINYDQLTIATESLPKIDSGTLYSHQLENNGGTSPFTWNLVRHYSESNNLGYYPQINGEQLILPDITLSRTFKKLEFDFPFYGKTYDSVWVHTSGSIMFDDQDYPWPYLFDEELMIKQTRNISPMLNKWFYIDDADNDGIWYGGDETIAAFRWKVSSNKSGVYDMNFSLILYPSGDIVFNYKQDNEFQFNHWAAGFSDGDQNNYKISETIDVMSSETQVVFFEPTYFPEEMKLSKDGIFHGTPMQNYINVPIYFQVTDYNNITAYKTLNFTSDDTGFQDSAFTEYNIRVFPNPSKSVFFVETNFSENSGLKFKLVNALGQQIAKIENYNTLFSIDMKEVAGGNSGVYYLICTDQKSNHSITKLVYTHY